MAEKSYFKMKYQYSLFWLIFWLIVFFPVGLVLLVTGIGFDTEEKSYRMMYEGSRFWLGFWMVVFFPVGLVLMFINGLGFSSTLTKR